MSEDAFVQDWTVYRERGSLLLIRFGVWIALGLGRHFARLFLYPICLYFLASSPTAMQSSRQYLKGVLKRQPRLIDVFRHFLTFASCVLDSVFLLNDRIATYDVRVHGEEFLRDIERRGGGCMMLLRRPIVMMIGLYRGGRTYDVFFEPLTDMTEPGSESGEAWIDSTMRRYVSRLEYFCRSAPFNWFNFYDFWRDINVRALLLWLCVGLTLSATFAKAEPKNAMPAWGLPQLMRELAQVKSAAGWFTERKTSQMLSSPLVTSGTLSYVAPDRVQKTILTPVEEQFDLNRNEITIIGGPDRQIHRFSLDDDPRIASLVQAIRATLAGDLPTLDRYYELQCTGDVAKWQLRLKPWDASQASLTAWIIIEGTDNRIRFIETESGNGDHSEMSVNEEVTNVR